MIFSVLFNCSISSVTATSGGSSRSAIYNNLDTNKLYAFIGAQLSMYSNLVGSKVGRQKGERLETRKKKRAIKIIRQHYKLLGGELTAT